MVLPYGTLRASSNWNAVRSLFRNVVSISLLTGLCSCFGDETGAAGGDPAASAESPICGENGSGFLARSSGSGLLAPGQRVLLELGTYAAVHPSCRFAVYGSTHEHKGIAFAGTLSAEQASELSDFLVLEEWESLEPQYRLCWADGPSIYFAWGDRRVDLVCGGGPEPPTKLRHDLLRLASELVELMRPWGEPVSGPVRFTLTEATPYDAQGDQYNDAPTWPLDAPPESFVGPGEYGPETVHDAAGEEAALLRSLRLQWMRGDFGSLSSAFIPIEQPDGSRFNLFVRDVVEFEPKFVPWATDGSLSVQANTTSAATRVRFSVVCEEPGGMTTHNAEGDLEVFSDDPSTDDLYWRGGVDELPLGECTVRLVAETDGTEAPCESYRSESTVSVSITAGWTSGVIFRCPI